MTGIPSEERYQEKMDKVIVIRGIHSREVGNYVARTLKGILLGGALLGGTAVYNYFKTPSPSEEAVMAYETHRSIEDYLEELEPISTEAPRLVLRKAEGLLKTLGAEESQRNVTADSIRNVYTLEKNRIETTPEFREYKEGREESSSIGRGLARGALLFDGVLLMILYGAYNSSCQRRNLALKKLDEEYKAQ